MLKSTATKVHVWWKTCNGGNVVNVCGDRGRIGCTKGEPTHYPAFTERKAW